MRTDNMEHKALFTIPKASYSTAIAVTKPLPPQRVITGHKQTDAYLWVLEVIQLNEPAHLEAAEAALAKIKIKPQDAQERYTAYLRRSGAHPLQIAFGSMSMDNPENYFKNARKAIEEAATVRGVFGSYEAALEDTAAERLMLVGELADVYAPFWGWTEQEIRDECMEGQRCFDRDEKREEISKGFAAQLPAPHMLSDVVREMMYWRWLYWQRNRASRELGYEYGDGDRDHITHRESYLESLLSTLKPVSRKEAIEVCQWVLKDDRFSDLGNLTHAIILNLVGSVPNA
ncbi:helix-turn-helix domain-containing protein [Rouxiella badensis]|uniref:helix-turn-helix domain-containing protein n=1 Tax=Rouxiella badensis TaxID=1646377 RepID=UPI0013EF497D|nr:helix-turn-helix domain-containing protein [Rouxiella badensis]QII37493.1 helix-turn-helix domain-containing protein [Rouxiella badensis]